MSRTRASAAFLLVGVLLYAGGAPTQAQQTRQGSSGAQGGQGSSAPAGATPAAPTPGSQDPAQIPTFRGGINFVRVDAIITDKKGQPVTDLKQSDFEITEDGKPQTIEQFKLIRVDGNVKPGDPPPHEIRDRDDEETEAAKDDVRIFAVLFDDYHVRLGNSVSMRDTLTKFIQTQIRPNDLVAFMYPLTPVDAVSFTRDQSKMLSAIRAFEGRKYDYRPRNDIEESYSRYPTETVEKIRNDVVMGALRGLSVRLGSMREGRKSVIFVSEGLTVQLPPQMRRADASGPQLPTAVADNSGTEMTQEWFNQSDLYSRLRDVFDAANRNNTSIYSLDPRGLAVFEYDINDGGMGQGPPGFDTDKRALQMTQDTLRTISEETDGRAIVNRNTLQEGLAQIVRDSSFYYLIGYNSTETPTDGKFHEIKVNVKRKGIDVRSRKGYWAASAADILKAANPTPETAKPVQQALATIATSVQAAKYIRTWIGTQRADSGKTRVTLVWEPLPLVPGARRDQAGRVSLLAATEQGDLVFRGGAPDAALASAARPAAANDAGATTARTPAAAAATAPQRIVFDAPPGKLELRMTVEAAGGGGTLDQEVRTIDVPDLTAPQASMSTPRVYRARTARDFQAMASDPNPVPVATREFSRTERLLIRFDAYGAGSERPEPTAVLLNRNGQKMSDVPVAPAPSGGSHQIDLGLNTIPAGEYLVEITVKGSGGEHKELVPFRVGA